MRSLLQSPLESDSTHILRMGDPAHREKAYLTADEVADLVQLQYSTSVCRMTITTLQRFSFGLLELYETIETTAHERAPIGVWPQCLQGTSFYCPWKIFAMCIVLGDSSIVKRVIVVC